MNFFKDKTIVSINILTMLVMFVFVVLFIAVVFYGEYNQFEKNAEKLQEEYIKKQKASIVFDTQRVQKFISYMYDEYHAVKNENDLKKEILEAIENFYERQDGTGYIFIYDFNGIVLSDPVQRNNIGRDFYKIEDNNGVKVIAELIRVSRYKEGGFVKYTWLKPTTKELSPKISYAKSFEPWKWMVGTGVYLDEIEKSISEERSKLEQKLNKYFIDIIFLLALLFTVGMMGIIIVNNILKSELDNFTEFFKKAASQYAVIDEKEISLLEFKRMVYYINKMIEEIHLRKKKLTELNMTLELKVEEKTKDLNSQNKLLIEEKQFSTSLIEVQDSFIKHSIHEINTPLAVIMTNIDLFKIKHGTNKYLSKIEAGSKVIANIYDDLSYMVKKNRFEYKKNYLNFSSFLKERIDFFHEISLGNNHKIISNIKHNIWITMNEEELQRIIDNNLSNAIKYANKGTNIIISLENNQNIILKFRTKSPKIEDTERIFKAFERENKVRGGFGLGLEIVNSIANKEKIKIIVESSDEETVFSYIFGRASQSS